MSAIERGQGGVDAPLPDGVGQGPHRARRRLGDERLHVVGRDRATVEGVAQRQLVELAGRDPAQVAALDVALGDPAAQPVGERAGRPGRQRQAAIARLGLDPGTKRRWTWRHRLARPRRRRP